MYKSNASAGRNNVSNESVTLWFFVMDSALCFSESFLGFIIRRWIPSTSDFHYVFQYQRTKFVNI